MRAECVINSVPDTPTRLDASPVDEHGPQWNGHKDALPPRLAFTIEETGHILGGVCPKTVRRLIARKLLHPSRALRRPLIPIWEIVRYLSETMPTGKKVDETLIRSLFESVLMNLRSKAKNED